MKRLCSVLVLIALALCIFVSCEATPSVDDGKVSDVNDVSWTIEVAGASKTSYSIEDAKAHELCKANVTGYNNNDYSVAPQITTRIWQGVLFSDFMKDVGAEGMTSATIYNDNGLSVTIDTKIAENEGTLLAWIENKKKTITNSSTYVAYGSELGGNHDLMLSVTKIEFKK